MVSINHVIYYLAILLSIFIQCFGESTNITKIMSREERAKLREEARDMFYHAYRAYMENAYPADELMPLSCAGRFRGLTPNRGDIDDSLGNFSLTLIDALDTLVILGDIAEFEDAIKLIIRDVSFDNDVIVSVFETNIRILGGLLSSHILAEYLQQRDNVLQWYSGQLLDMAKDVGYRLLPAFNTTTGIPHSRVNLKYGLKGDRLESAKETCTACAGSIILEMAALSRLTGEPIFEEKAHRVMDQLWKMRHRSSDLMGTVLNVHSGDWVRRDSGVGAGIDSYYEYCLKAYILLGDEKYLDRFNRHYNAVMKYISQGPMLLDVHMHRPHTNSRNFMDALLAFWPGLQVLKGDIKPAVETHEMLYQVTQRHKFIPEAFTTDFQVHWGNHPLRPEFLESTYFLYSATKDPYYLEVGKDVLKSLQKYARVPCGYAAVNDVRTAKQEDRMDSFVLAETFKYLYLLFTDEEDLILNLDEFIFTTEGHLLPLNLAGQPESAYYIDFEDSEFARSCPNTLMLFPESLRKPLQNMVDGSCVNEIKKPRLSAAEFSAYNVQHLKLIKEMGLSIIALNDGRLQIYHQSTAARSKSAAQEGLEFLEEMMLLEKEKSQQREEIPYRVVTFTVTDSTGIKHSVSLIGGPSNFGNNLSDNKKVTARTLIVDPIKGCSDLKVSNLVRGRIAIIERGDCMFVEKARRVQKLGAVGAIIIDNTPNSSAATMSLFSMSGDDTNDVTIPTIFLYNEEANKLVSAILRDPAVEVTISEYKSVQNDEESMFEKLKQSVQEFLNKHSIASYSESIRAYDFLAELSADKIRITYERVDNKNTVLGEEEADEQWGNIRRGMLYLIFYTKPHELIIPNEILQFYYRSFSGLSPKRIKESDVKTQTVWLMKHLTIEQNKEAAAKVKNSLLKIEKNSGTSYINVFDDLIERVHVLPADQKREIRGRSKENASSSDRLAKLEENRNDGKENFVESSALLDSLVIADYKEESDTVLVTEEHVETSENKSDKNIESKNSHATTDEL